MNKDLELAELHSLVVHQLQIGNQPYSSIMEGVIGLSLLTFLFGGFLIFSFTGSLENFFQITLPICAIGSILITFWGIQNKRFINSIQKLYDLTQGTDKKTEDYIEILNIFKTAKNSIPKGYYTYAGPNLLMQEVVNNRHLYFKKISENLTQDLYLQIKKTKSLLESTQDSLSPYIKGTGVVRQISELQRTRLNKQIEQFEELQRILMRMYNLR